MVKLIDSAVSRLKFEKVNVDVVAPARLDQLASTPQLATQDCHWNVTPAGALPTKPSETDCAFSLALFFSILSEGGVTFDVTTASSESKQPFAGFVTTRWYVPAASTVGVAVFPPDTM